MKTEGLYLRLQEVPNGLEIRLTDLGRDMLRRLATRLLDYEVVAELFADFVDNGWRLFSPAEHGLTDSRLGVIRTDVDRWYWHGNYAVEDASEELRTKLYLNLAT